MARKTPGPHFRMTFAWPTLLWLLLIPAIVAVWDIFRRRASIVHNAPQRILRGEVGARTVSIVDKQPSRLARFRVSQPYLLVGLTCSIIALARPQWGLIEEQVFDQSREIVIAIDLSRSMLTPDVKPSRLERSKLLIHALLDRLAGERVGLVVFSGTAFLQCPLSADYEILREFLPSLTPKYLPEGGTNYSALLKTSIDAFAGGNGAADRFLIILSDGEALDDQWKPLVEDLKKRSVRALCLGVGTSNGGMIPEEGGGFVKDERGAVVLSKLASATLQELASATGGTYRDASTWVDLPRLLQDTVEAGRQGRFEEKREARRIERFQWALGPALFFLLLSWWREFPVKIRPRSIPLDPNKTGSSPSMKLQSSASSSSSIASVILIGTSLTLFLLSSLSISAAVKVTPPAGMPLPPIGAPQAPQSVSPDAGEPLSLTVKRLAGLSAPLARDWAAMANDTLSWGQQLRAAQQTIPPGPINDGLAAVDEGEKLDPKAADWKKLREDLSALLRQDQKQQKDENKDQDKSQDNNQQNQKKQDQSKQEPQKKSQPENRGPNQNEKDKQQQSQQGAQNKENQQNGSDQKSENSDGQPKQESAFGEMGKQPQKEKEPSKSSAPQEMQKVGGSEKKDPIESTNPALTVPLQRLEKIKEQDSPARLFQILEGQKKGAPAQPGRNW